MACSSDSPQASAEGSPVEDSSTGSNSDVSTGSAPQKSTQPLPNDNNSSLSSNEVHPPPLGDNASGVRLDLTVMKPQLSIENITDPVTVSGVISGNCTGNIRVDAEQNDLQIPEGKPLPGPLVAITLSSVGEFSFPVPRGKSISLVAFCDQDKNQKIEQTVDLSSAPQNLGILEADQGNIELKLSTLSELIQQQLPPIDKQNLPTIPPHAQE